MKFVLCIAALLSVALAASVDDRSDRPIRKRTVQNNVPVNVAAMSRQDGTVVEFDSKNVYMAGQVAGI